MIDENIEAPPESVFLTTVRHCPPSAVGTTRGILEICDRFMPDLQPDESLRQANGELLPQAAALTALAAVKKLLGSIHPAVRTMEHDLRGEWQR